MKPFILFTLLFPCCSYAQHLPSAKKTTAMPLRLIASTTSGASGTGYYLSDSTVYNYSGSRSSNLARTEFDGQINFGGYNNYDSAITYNYDTIAHAYSANMKNVQSFDAFDNIQGKARYTWMPSTTVWQKNNQDQHVFTYDAANHILTDLTQYWNTSTASWNDLLKSLNSYDGSGRLTMRVRQQWNTTTSSWDDRYRDNYTYDASGNMLTYIMEGYNTPVWENYSKHTYTYTGGNLVSDQYQEWVISWWENYAMTSYSGHISGVPQVSIGTLWNSSTATYDNSLKITYSYNSYGQADYAYAENWNNATNSWENVGMIHNYYAYPTAAGNVQSRENTVNIYPVPAQNTLNVSVQWAEPQPFTVGIYDIAGRLINSWNIASCATHTHAIPVSDLAPGNYVIRLQGSLGNESRQITIK